MNGIVPFVALVAVVFTAGCRHTNNLSKYNFSGKTLMYESRVEADAAQVYVDITPRNGSSTAETVGVLVGGGLAGASAQNKLVEAINTTDVCNAVTKGYAKTMDLYLQPGSVVKSASERPAFVIRTTLEKYRLFSNSMGVCSEVQATISVLSTETGEVVWEDFETEVVPLRLHGVGAGAATASSMGTIGGVVSAAVLLTLSKEELQKMVLQSAEEIGADLGDTLREDFFELKKK